MRPAIALALLTAIAGCRETHHCPPGQSYQGGLCLDLDGGTGHDAGRDAAIDAAVDVGNDTGSDAGNDGGMDAGPCGPCATGVGAVCSDHADAGSDGGPLHCVPCVVDDDCAPIDAGGYDASAFIDAGPIPGRAICENFQCVFGCRSDGDCSTLICRGDRQCSEFPPPASANSACLPCDSSRNCNTGEDCVETFYPDDAHSEGFHCVPRLVVSAGCTIPFASAVMRQPIEGGPLQGYCVPNEALAGCDATRSTLLSRHCMSADDCALRGAADGARCELIGTAMECTYSCGADGQCPTGLTCIPNGYCH